MRRPGLNLPIIRNTIVLAALLALTACGTPFREEAALEGKSLILAAVEVNADYGESLLKSPPGKLYNMTLQLWGYEQSRGNIRQTYWPQSFTTRSRWIAFAVDPGTYALGEIVEEGSDSTLTIDKNRKTTKFGVEVELPLFEVAPNEALYIGTFRAQLGTNFGDTFGQLGGRLLRDARKTYVLQTGLARTIASPYTEKGGRFREINLFSKSPAAFAKYSVPWSRRPGDADFDPEPVDEVEGGKGRDSERDSLGE